MRILNDRLIHSLKSIPRFGLWVIRFMFLLGLFNLVSIVWGVIEVFQAPYDGLSVIARSGIVEYVDPVGPTADLVFVGDIVREIEIDVNNYGLSLYEAEGIGDEVQLTILRKDRIFNINFILRKEPLQELFSSLVPIIVSILFYIVSIIIFSLKPWDFTIKLFYLTSQLGALCLIFGQQLVFFRPGLVGPYLTLLAIVGPLSVHFHARLLTINSWYLEKLFRFSYFVSFIAIAIYLLNWKNIYSIDNHFFLNQSAPILLILNWVVVIFILAYSYFRSDNLAIKGVVRLVSLGGLFGIIPIVVFSLIPSYITGQSILPIQSGFLLLGIIPFSYGYAILRHRLVRVEDQLSRPAAQMLVYAFVFGSYFLIITLIQAIEGLNFLGEPIFFTIIVVILGWLFGPLKKSFYKLINLMIYGGSYDYRSMVMATAQEISNSQNLERLADQIVNIFKMMNFPSGFLFQVSTQEIVQVVEFGGDHPEIIKIEVNGEIIRSLRLQKSPCWSEDLRKSIDAALLTAGEIELLTSSKFRLWVPLTPRAELRGFLLLRSKFGKEAMTSEDLDILQTLGSLIAIALENVDLLESLQEKIVSLEIAEAEVSESRRRLEVGRENERLHLARELHDGAIQDLHAIRIKLGGLESAQLYLQIQAVNDQVLEVIYDLRDLCTTLRPPSLAHFGLKAAIKSLVDKFEVTDYSTNYWLDAQFNGLQHNEHSEFAIFRILQESLNNVSYHAQANNVWVRYSEGDQIISLEIVDDGIGFVVPENLLDFAREGHLGLLGIAERSKSIGGLLKVESSPGKGSHISVIAARNDLLKKIKEDLDLSEMEEC